MRNKNIQNPEINAKLLKELQPLCGTTDTQKILDTALALLKRCAGDIHAGNTVGTKNEERGTFRPYIIKLLQIAES